MLKKHSTVIFIKSFISWLLYTSIKNWKYIFFYKSFKIRNKMAFNNKNTFFYNYQLNDWELYKNNIKVINE